MANLIIKSSSNDLVIQGSDASPAITVAAAGTTTFAENATLSGTANNLGTVTAGTISNAATGVNQKIFGFSAYLSTAKTCNNATWTEIDTTWTEYFDTGGKFGTTSGRFTPTVAGVYHCGYVTDVDEVDDNERIIAAIRLNGSGTESTGEFIKFQNRAPGTNSTVTAGGSGLIVLDADDYISLWAYQDGGGNDPVNVNSTKLWAYYVGTV